MNVFETLPRDFFWPLASKGAEIYLSVLFALWKVQRFNPLLERTVLLSHINDVLQKPDALTLTEDDIREDAEKRGEIFVSSLSERASGILLYLHRRGWLREEEPTEFERVYTLPHYAQKMLEVLEAIGSHESPQIRGLICSIRDLLKQAENEGTDIEVRVPEAYRQTIQLQNGLSALQDQMREHIQRVAQQRQTSKVLTHFSNYYDMVSDIAYKQLKTTDHVSRFRPQVLDAIGKLDELKRLLPVARSMLAQAEARTESEALSQLEENLAFIRGQFEALHTHLSTLDDLNGRYTSTVAQAIQRDIYAQSTVSGFLQTFLQERLHYDVLQSDVPPDDIKELINLFTFSYIEEGSLSPPRSAPQPFTAEMSIAPKRIEPAERDIARSDLLSQMRVANSMSRSAIATFVLRQLQDCHELRASGIPVTDIRIDMPRLMLIWAYGDGSLGYYVSPLPDAPWFEHPELHMSLQDFLICRGSIKVERKKR